MTKKKTVKELNEDFIVLEKRVNEMEKRAKVLEFLEDVNLKELNEKLEILNFVKDDSKMIEIEKKVNHNESTLKDILSKNKVTTAIEDLADNKDFSVALVINCLKRNQI